MNNETRSHCGVEEFNDRNIDNRKIDKSKVDMINHPPHYQTHKIECIEVLEALGIAKDFCRGNAIKYLFRMNKKECCVEDSQKAVWYLNRLISILEDEEEEKIQLQEQFLLQSGWECECGSQDGKQNWYKLMDVEEAEDGEEVLKMSFEDAIKYEKEVEVKTLKNNSKLKNKKSEIEAGIYLLARAGWYYLFNDIESAKQDWFKELEKETIKMSFKDAIEYERKKTELEELEEELNINASN